ncbi:MAG: hypothetical protein R2726_16445 [Acidimicrobiales bacterium]
MATEDLAAEADLTRQRISRLHVDGVIEAPGGAHFTECPPDYGRDESFQRTYAKVAADPEAWAAFTRVARAGVRGRLPGGGGRPPRGGA